MKGLTVFLERALSWKQWWKGKVPSWDSDLNNFGFKKVIAEVVVENGEAGS